MAGKEFVVKGAMCLCKYGVAPAILDVTDNNAFKINGGKLAATDKTLGSVFGAVGFGTCNISPPFVRKCTPVITQWSESYKSIKTSSGGSPLTEKSKATCSCGTPECIEILMTGQIPIPGAKDMAKASKEHQGELDCAGSISALSEHPISAEIKISTYRKKKQIVNESIVIVGEENSKSQANKLMFPAQGVREIKYMKLDSQLSDSLPDIYPKYGTFIIFKDSYTKNQLTAIGESVVNVHKGKYIEISNLNQLFNYINTMDINNASYIDSIRDKPFGSEIIKIKNIYIFSHGLIGHISFGYGGTRDEQLRLTAKNISSLNPDVFSPNAILYAYSCRTGLDENASKEDVILTTPDPKNSLAQKIANLLNITVMAYQRRTNYENTWGSPNHTKTYMSDNDAAESAWKNFMYDGYDALFPDPKDYNQWLDYFREKKVIDGADWHKDGAYLPVRGGDSPGGSFIGVSIGVKISAEITEYKP